MGRYIVKRIGYMLLVLVILSFLMFIIYNMVPSNRAYTDAKAEIQTMKKGMSAADMDTRFQELYLKYQRRYGTDTNNMVIRYLRWVGLYPLYDGSYSGLLQGNFGYSYEARDEVINVVKPRMGNTIFINIFATILALGITIPLGIHCAVKKNSRGDQAVQMLTIIGYSLPTFLIAILFIWIFCSLLHMFPAQRHQDPGQQLRRAGSSSPTGCIILALPLIVMTFCSLGGMTRYVRASMIEALSMDCIKTARAKGVREKAIIYSHAWRNALIPIVTLVVGWFLGIFSGSVVIEQMFALNGMGDLMISSLRTADFDVIMLLQMFYVMLSLLGNLVIDIVYGLVDPRVRVSK